MTFKSLKVPSFHHIFDFVEEAFQRISERFWPIIPLMLVIAFIIAMCLVTAIGILIADAFIWFYSNVLQPIYEQLESQ